MRAGMLLVLVFFAVPAMSQSFHECRNSAGKIYYNDGPCDGVERAGVLRKCVAAGGAISYQTAPCSGSQKETKALAFRPDDAPSDAQQWQRQRAAEKAQRDSQYLQQQARRARTGTGPSTVIRPDSCGIDRCADAKRQRDAYLETEHGRHTGYDGRRAWNDRVYDACK